MIEWVSPAEGCYLFFRPVLCSAPCTLTNGGGDVKDGLARGKPLCKPHQSGRGEVLTSFFYLFAHKDFQGRWILMSDVCLSPGFCVILQILV